jgi:hypothetical protein
LRRLEVSCLKDLRNRETRIAGWLVHEQVDVLGHDDVGVDAGLMTGAGFL